MYICTQTEIKYGQLDKQDWDALFIHLTQRNDFSISFLAKEILPKFLNSKLGFALINILHMREEDGLNPRHLSIVRGGRHAQEEGLGEAGDG